MNCFFQYFILELKRTIRMFPSFIGSILILIITIVAGLGIATLVLKENQIFDTVKVDVVIHEEETEIQLAAALLEHMESVESICKFTYVTEEEARENIKNGKSDMAILIEKDFYEDMDTGVNTPAVLLMPQKAALQTKVFGELVSAGVSLVQTTEAAVYAVFDAEEVYGLKVTYDEMQELIFYNYVKKILNRNHIFQKNVLSATGEYDVIEYYFSGGLILCVLISCINFGFLYGKSEENIEEMLYVYGLGRRKIAIAKISVIGISLSIITFLLLGISHIAGRILGKEFFEINAYSILEIFLICISMAVIMHVIYRTGKEKGTIFVFFFIMVMTICSGIIVPLAYYPVCIQRISRYNPMVYWAEHMLLVLNSEFAWKSVCMELLMIVIGLLAEMKWGNKWKT